ncbi:ATPase domain-containing protein [Natribaculum luteum]|uniref:ATPase domain-containing protein n=1 Tax=Natribaculum luteum TaxID=1586232 RepID=A0ABD5P3P5_9EURY|nr:ATPase domain-containing protein [Natribaculum luteum]
MAYQQSTEQRSGQRRRCAYCGYSIPEEPHRSEAGREFCSRSCLEAFDEEESIPAEDAYERFETGVEPLDSLVPTGLPADAFLLLSGEEGTRRSELLTELVWRALERGEPAVVVAYVDPPTAVLERFFRQGWNVLPYLEDDRLRIVDCFTHRLEDRDEFVTTLNEWNRFLADAGDDAVIDVERPGDVRAVANALQRGLDDLEMTETGLVVLDSLDELDALVQDQLVHNFVKDVRASVCKARYVPIIAAATPADDDGRLVGDEPVYDGVVDLRLTDRLVPESRLKQLGIRKLVGTAYDPQWTAYEHAPGRGLLSFDPTTEAGSVYEQNVESRTL